MFIFKLPFKFMMYGLCFICFMPNVFSNFVLITSLYNETRSPRIYEYKECLEKNLGHDLITHVHVLYDTSKDESSSNNSKQILCYLQGLEKEGRVSISYIKGRPSFEYMFDFVNEIYPNQELIISNADIYFNYTLKHANYFDLRRYFLGITRWNVGSNSGLSVQWSKRYNRPNTSSNDVWIFKTPIKNFARNKEFYLGTLHFEKPLARAASYKGYKVINPYQKIQCCHLHLSRLRSS